MTQWTDQDPGAGEFEDLESRKSRLAAQRDHAMSMQDVFSRAASGVGEHWAGGGHDAWATRAASTAAKWGRLHTWADSEYQALSRYETDVESIATSAARQTAILSDAGLTLLKTSFTSTTAASDPFIGTPATDPVRDDALAATAGANRALAALALERQEADRRATASIRLIRETYLGTPTPTMPAGLTVSSLNRLTPEQLLATLTALTPGDLHRLAGAEPDLAAQLQKADPRIVASWWKSLGKAQQDSFATDGSILIGNLEGVDYTHRDIANRAVLASERKRLTAARQMLSEHQEWLVLQSNSPDVMESADWIKTQEGLDATSASLLTLTSVAKTLAYHARSTHTPQLINLSDIETHAKAAISIGDLDTADHVTFLVPGMGATVSGSMSAYAAGADNLAREQDVALGRYGKPGTTAVVAWLGYTAPGPTDVNGVLGSTLARKGATELRLSLDGVKETRGWSGETKHLAVVGHSYGSTVGALSVHDTSVGEFVMLGSAGIEGSVKSVADLKVPQDQVFASQGRHDGWAPVGQIFSGRKDPTSPSFKADVFSSETVRDGATTFQGITQHGPLVHIDGSKSYSYLDNDTESLHNTALASVGLGVHVTPG